MSNYDYTVSSITLPNGTVVEIKDAVARAAQESGMHFIGISEDVSLTDGYTTAAISIIGAAEDITAIAGDIVIKGSSEFVFDGTEWHEMGDLSTLGALASKSSASATYTPSGTVSGASVTLSTVTKYVASTSTGGGSVTGGSVSSFSASVDANEVLVFNWTAGTPTSVTLPTFESQTIAYAVSDISQGSFTGASSTITVS